MDTKTEHAPRPNATKVFGELLSVEAWHSGFEETNTASVHVDVVIKTARLGQEQEAPVRFKLHLRRAEVLFVIPPNEPLKILHESVARDQSLRGGTLKKSSRSGKSKKAQALASATVSERPNLSINAEGRIGAETSEEESFESEDSVRLILSTHSKTPEGHHAWELVSASGPSLQGKVWDAVDEPRLSIRDARSKSGSLEGTCRIEIRCKREDLLIEEITLKDAGLLKRLAGDNTYHNRVAAAESYIRSILSGRSLDHDDIREIFGDIYLASVIVEPVIR